VRGLFDIAWDYPSVEPPNYLQQLSPELYRQECQRVTARFDEAVRLAEQAFLDELSKLVAHLTERLSGDEDGKPKVFRDSAVANLTEFFERFRHLNVGSNEQLDQLVSQAQQTVRGVVPISTLLGTGFLFAPRRRSDCFPFRVQLTPSVHLFLVALASDVRGRMTRPEARCRGWHPVATAVETPIANELFARWSFLTNRVQAISATETKRLIEVLSQPSTRLTS
jgi:hypothetical protein